MEQQEIKKEKKIDLAIRDTKNRLEFVKQEIMLMSRERDVLQKQIDMLEGVRENKHYE